MSDQPAKRDDVVEVEVDGVTVEALSLIHI